MELKKRAEIGMTPGEMTAVRLDEMEQRLWPARVSGTGFTFCYLG